MSMAVRGRGESPESPKRRTKPVKVEATAGRQGRFSEEMMFKLRSERWIGDSG